MLKRLWLTAIALAALGGPTLTFPAASAEEKDKKPAAPDAATKAVDRIALANNLAVLGRESKSPEMLLAAARILRTVKTTPGEGEPKVEGDKEEKAPEAKPVTLLEESDRLLRAARDLAPDDRAVADLADQIAKITGRDALGGPRAFTRAIRPGVTHVWNVNFIGGRPARISVTGNGIAYFTLEATGPRGAQYVWTGLHPSLSFVPAGGFVNIRVTNDGPGVATYTIYHN